MTGFGDVAGFVLVGGRSSRMGTDKALMNYHGLPLAGYIASVLSRAAGSVDPARYSGIEYPVINDDHPAAGPAGGLVTALRASGSRWNIVTACDVTACDLPGVSAEFFDRLLDRSRHLDVQCVVPVTPDGRAQVLCAVYRRDAREALATAVESGEAKLRIAIQRFRADYWPVEAGEWPVNLNTPEDWNVYMRQEA